MLKAAAGWRQASPAAAAAGAGAAAALWRAAAGIRSVGSLGYNGPSEVVIALGSNQGNRVDNLLDGLAALAQHGIEVLRVSLLYETAPMYVTEQPAYLNAAMLGRTDVSPLQLLYHLKQIEKAAGRDVTGGLRWSARPLDLDIIFYGAQDVTHEALTVPHISWRERGFVKAPLADLLQPDDIRRGYIAEHHPAASSLDRLLQALQQWEAEGGEEQVGQPGLCRVLPIHRQIWELGHSSHICGILNITPDSFSDGGRYVARPAAAAAAAAGPSQRAAQQQPLPQQQQPASSSPSQPSSSSSSSYHTAPPSYQPYTSVRGSLGVDVAGALEAARAMARAGARVIDVGGQSTRPGSARLPAEEELARVIPVIRALRDDSELVHIPVSIDTYSSSVAAEAVAAGADMINDVTGGLQDPRMLATAARLGVPYVLTHTRGDLSSMNLPANTTYDCVWREVGAALKQRAQLAVAAGVLPWNLVLDPGLGFAKTVEGNAELLGNLAAMRREALRGVWGRMPLLVGPSRKHFIGHLTGRDKPEERDLGTVAACVAAVAQGADIVRVHNVPLVAEALSVADAVLRRSWPHLCE